MSRSLCIAQDFSSLGCMTNSRPSISRIQAGFWLRALQYNIDRCQAASLEERAVAALKLTRAQEAMDRLCGSG